MASEINIPKKELRYIADAQIRTASDGRITGYAAVFNSLSDDLGGFRERIMPGAFRRAITSKMDVRALINHDPSKIIGRTAARTLELTEDAKGLSFSCKLPDTSYAQDLAASIRRGDISQCSFGFSMREERFTKENGERVRELLDLDLFDVSAVTYPAYPETSVEARSAHAERPYQVQFYIDCHSTVGGYPAETEEEGDRRRRLRLAEVLRTL